MTIQRNVTTVHDRINDFLNSRTVVVVAAVVYVALSYYALLTQRFTLQDGGSGVFFDFDVLRTMTPAVSFAVNTALVIGIAFLLGLLNKTFHFIRSVSHVFPATFLLLQSACPYCSTQFYAGTMLCLVLVLCTFVLFARYQQPSVSMRNIFLVSVVIAACCMVQYVFLLLVPVFLIGFMQMRALSFRGLLAMALGLITPYWIVIGTGLVDPLAYRLPQFSTIWTSLDLSQVQVAIGWVVLVAVLAVVLTIVNQFTIYNYRLRLRLLNAFFTMLIVVSVIVMSVNYNDMMMYVPILNLCFALQVGHSFTISQHPKRYILQLLLIASVFAAWSAQIAV